MKKKRAVKKKAVSRRRIRYVDRVIERLVITGKDTVVLTLPDESTLAIRWLPK